MPRKSYALEASPLFRLPSKRKLCDHLRIDPKRLRNMQGDALYRIWQNGTGRTIEEPSDSLTTIHRRFQRLLSRIEHPEWVFSGIRGRSYVDNARQHTEKRCLCSIDINSFFQSARREYVFRFLHYVLRQPDDIAWILTDILTYETHLPTGSPSSQILAFWAYKPMFVALHNIADGMGATLTLYVDDIAISSDRPLDGNALRAFERVVAGFDLRLKERKTRQRDSSQWKLITGVAISPTGDIEVPNRLRERIRHLVVPLKAGTIDDQGLASLLGMLTSARQIDPSFHESLYQYVRYLLRQAR